MVEVEVRIWDDKKKERVPLIIRGKNFAPLSRAMDIIDEQRTGELVSRYRKNLKRLVEP